MARTWISAPIPIRGGGGGLIELNRTKLYPYWGRGGGPSRTGPYMSLPLFLSLCGSARDLLGCVDFNGSRNHTLPVPVDFNGSRNHTLPVPVDSNGSRNHTLPVPVDFNGCLKSAQHPSIPEAGLLLTPLASSRLLLGSSWLFHAHLGWPFLAPLASWAPPDCPKFLMGSCWLLLPPPGSCWLTLVPPASPLALLGSSWLLLAPPGSSWLLLAPPGSCSSWLLFLRAPPLIIRGRLPATNKRKGLRR